MIFVRKPFNRTERKEEKKRKKKETKTQTNGTIDIVGTALRAM